MKIKFLSLLVIIVFCNSVIIGQYITLNGAVVCSTSPYYPIENASIKCGKFGCITKAQGEFSLNIDLKTLSENAIICTHIGYATKKIKGIKSNFFLTIKLDSVTKTLESVTVSAGINTIVKKAIERIDSNYATNPFILSGILRLIAQQDNGYFYNSDALIKIYTPPYTKQEESKVELIKNRLNVVTSPYYDSSTTIRWIQAYRAVARQDFVHNRPAFINLLSMKYFTYSLRDKETRGDKKVFVIDFFSHDGIKGEYYKKMEGTLYIDTANFAFVGGDFTYYDIKELFFNKIIKSTTSIVYEEGISNRYYVKEYHSKTEYAPKEKINSKASIDFMAESIDTTDIKPFSYEKIIQNSDVCQRTNNLADSLEWKKYDSLFVKAESNGSFVPALPPSFDIIKKPSKFELSKGYKTLSRFVNYIRDNNLREGISIERMPFSITNNSNNISPIANYALGFNVQFRVYKTLFYQLDTYFNLGLGGLKNNESGYYLLDEITLKKKNRPIILAPKIGYSHITSKDSRNTTILDYWDTGFTTSFEWTHKKSVLVGGNYNYQSNKSNPGASINTSKYSYSVGLVYKL